jgi:WD40 repeat protein
VLILDSFSGKVVNFIEKAHDGIFSHNISLSPGSVLCLGLSSNKEIFATGSGDKSVKVWKPEEKKAVLTIKNAHKGRIFMLKVFIIQGPVTCLTFSKSDSWIISGSEDFYVKIWALKGGKLLASLKPGKVEVGCYKYLI